MKPQSAQRGQKDERRTFNAQHRMLNVKTGFLLEVRRWKFDVERLFIMTPVF
jgi:hypothetical protein